MEFRTFFVGGEIGDGSRWLILAFEGGPALVGDFWFARFFASGLVRGGEFVDFELVFRRGGGLLVLFNGLGASVSLELKVSVETEDSDARRVSRGGDRCRDRFIPVLMFALDMDLRTERDFSAGAFALVDVGLIGDGCDLRSMLIVVPSDTVRLRLGGENWALDKLDSDAIGLGSSIDSLPGSSLPWSPVFLLDARMSSVEVWIGGGFVGLALLEVPNLLVRVGEVVDDPDEADFGDFGDRGGDFGDFGDRGGDLGAREAGV